MGMIRVIYVSTAVGELTPSDIESILDASARNNGAAGVTGMLLFAGGTFMQVLEGEQAAVEQTYERIGRDPRHCNLFEMSREDVSEREFARWHMGFRRLAAADASGHPAFAPFFQQGFDPARLGAKPGVALEVLREFARGNT